MKCCMTTSFENSEWGCFAVFEVCEHFSFLRPINAAITIILCYRLGPVVRACMALTKILSVTGLCVVKNCVYAQISRTGTRRDFLDSRPDPIVRSF